MQKSELRTKELIKDLELHFGRSLTYDEQVIVRYVDDNSFEKGRKEVFDLVNKN